MTVSVWEINVVSGKVDSVSARDLEPDALILTNGDVKSLLVVLREELVRRV